MVKCTVPVQLFDEFRGEYALNKEYPDDGLAEKYPRFFQMIEQQAEPQKPATKKKK